MNAKHKVTFIITISLALSIVACGADKGPDTTPEPVAPAPAPESGDRPNVQEQGQAPAFEGGARGGGPMGFMTIISEATRLDVETLQEEAAGGTTLAEIITANGGDVETRLPDLSLPGYQPAGVE